MSKKSRIYNFLYANAEKEKEVALKALKIRFSLSLPKAEILYKEWRKECMAKPFKVVQDETLKIYAVKLVEKRTKKRRKKYKKVRKKYEKGKARPPKKPITSITKKHKAKYKNIVTGMRYLDIIEVRNLKDTERN